MAVGKELILPFIRRVQYVFIMVSRFLDEWKGEMHWYLLPTLTSSDVPALFWFNEWIGAPKIPKDMDMNGAYVSVARADVEERKGG